MKLIKLLIFPILIILAFYFYDRFNLHREIAYFETINTNPEIKKILRKKLDAKGPEKTLVELKILSKDKDTSFKHSATHIYGELIYEKFGTKALTYCDDYYTYGCYHGFFTKAIMEKGIGIVQEMDKACLAKYGKLDLGCQHGLGHGLYEFFGETKLTEALTVCITSTTQQDHYGCMSGVFMAYNLPKIINEIETIYNYRKFDKDNPYSICPTIQSEFQHSCYFELGQWWHHIFNNDFNKIGKLCMGILDQENRELCLEGINNIVADTSNYDVEKIKKYCQEMPNLQSISLCRMRAVQSFIFTNPVKLDQAEKLCEGLGDNFYKKCKNNIRQVHFRTTFRDQ